MKLESLEKDLHNYDYPPCMWSSPTGSYTSYLCPEGARSNHWSERMWWGMARSQWISKGGPEYVKWRSLKDSEGGKSKILEDIKEIKEKILNL